MKCTSHLGNNPTEEWLRYHSSTPSVVHDIKAELIQAADNHGSKEPILKVSWSISVDGSIQVLNGTMISVRVIGDHANVQQFRCTYRDFTDVKKYTGHLANFSFNRFVVRPDTTYEISAYNLPTANINEDRPSKTEDFTTPGCSDSIMKFSRHCIDSGSLWDPDITTCRKCEMLEMNFTTSRNGRYEIYLYTCSMNDSASCYDQVGDASITEANEERKMVRFNLTGKTAEYIEIIISPHFSACRNDCPSHSKMVDMSSESGKCVTFSEKATSPDIQPHVIIGITSICFTFAILVFMIHGICRYGKMKKLQKLHATVPSVRVKVLLVYPSDSKLFQNIALAFAEFLHIDCLSEVALDLWQMRSIAEIGPVQWLSLQKQMSDKVIFLCLNRTTVHGNSYLEDSNHRDSRPSDMFALALNLFCSDIKHSSALKKYMVVYFDEISSEKDLPLVLTACSRYNFMKTLKRFCKDLHNISEHEVFPSVNSDSMDCKYSSKQTTKLNDAICELKNKTKTSLVAQMEEDCLIEFL